MKAREKSKLTINGYGAFTSPDLESVSVVLHHLKGYLVQSILVTGPTAKAVIYGAVGCETLTVNWSEENQYWWGGL